MKITSVYMRNENISITDAIRGTIEDAGYYKGSLEQLHSKVEKTAEILGQLIQALHETDRLSDAQVVAMFHYRYNMETR